MILAVSLTVTAKYSNPVGDGTLNNPIQIHNLNDLKYLSETQSEWNNNFVLTGDIDASPTSEWKDISTDIEAKGFSPIGTKSFSFGGNFDGNNHAIKNLYIKRYDNDYVGLFGYAENGSIFDLSLLNANISGNKFVGALTGYIASNITNCFSTGIITGKHVYGYAGGLFGFSYNCIIANSSSEATVSTVTNQAGGFIGGVGVFSETTNCFAIGIVSGHAYIGGFAGVNSGKITRCYATGGASGNSDYIGGLTGSNCAIIKENYTLGKVEGKGRIGGISGDNYSGVHTIQNCFSRCLLTGEQGVGGIVGENHATVSNCYAICSINGPSWILHDDCLSGYSTKKTNNLYCLQGSGNNKYGTALTQVEFIDAAKFINWDFSNVWEITKNDEIDNIHSYPYLKWMQGYTVNFDANGGTGAMVTMNKQKGMIKLPVNTYTRIGYSFVGWAMASDGDKTYENNITISITENITLYALWKKNIS